MAIPSERVERDVRDVRGTVGALVFIVVGLVCWWDVRDMPSAQAVVFPKTVIGLMIAFSALLILRNLVGYAAPEPVGPSGSVIRRVSLLAVMVAATLVMPYVGFVIAALVAYFAIMVLAMYERWTGVRLLLYPVAGVIVVIGFYVIFKEAFRVPLPESTLFDGLF